MFKVTVQRLSKRFGNKTIFKNIDFESKYSSFGISGYNGSGKTTLLKCLGYMLRPSTGSVTWSQDENEWTPEIFRLKSGYAAPYINHYAELTSLENLFFIGRLRQVPEYTYRSKEILRSIGLSEHMEEAFGNLSSGQQQRLKLAANLLYEPDILFLDEPGTNLDDEGHSLVEKIIGEWRDKKKMIVLASNDHRELDLVEEVIKVDHFVT